jgi:hypothetical protein
MYKSLFYQLLICNLFTQHVKYLLRRDTSSELWTPVLFFTLLNQPQSSSVYFLQFYFTANISFHSIQLILCFQQTGEIDNLTVSWGKVFWLCCDRFHIVADAGSAPCQIVSRQHLRKRLSSPTGRLNLGFLLRETLLVCSSYLPLGVPQRCAI